MEKNTFYYLYTIIFNFIKIDDAYGMMSSLFPHCSNQIPLSIFPSLRIKHKYVVIEGDAVWFTSCIMSSQWLLTIDHWSIEIINPFSGRALMAESALLGKIAFKQGNNVFTCHYYLVGDSCSLQTKPCCRERSPNEAPTILSRL